MGNFRKHSAMAFAAATTSLVLAGCANRSVVRKDPPALPFASTMQAELRFSQKEMLVNHDPSIAGAQAGNQAGMQAAMNPQITHGTFAGGAAAGLIGALVGGAIDAAVNAHRAGVAEELTKPIRANTSAIDFNAMIEQSFDGLDKHEFADDLHIVRLETTLNEDEKANRLALGEPVLVLVPAYYVTYDETNFVYQLGVVVADRKRDGKGRLTTTERYREVFRYFVPRSQYGGIAHWGDLSADQWKEMFQVANTEMIAMLNYDVAARPNDAGGIVKDGRLPEHVDKDNGERLWLRTQWTLRSVLKSSLPPEKHA